MNLVGIRGYETSCSFLFERWHLMPASRSCAACGATLSPDVRWCGQCAEPVRYLTPRPPLHNGDFVGPLLPARGRTSRWRESPTTFGPAGRLTITCLLALGVPFAFVTMGSAFWPTGLWFLLAYALFSAVVLRDVWKSVPVEDDIERMPRTGRTQRIRHRFPVLDAEIRTPRGVGLLGVVTLVAATTYLYVSRADALHGFFAIAGMLALAFGFALARWLFD